MNKKIKTLLTILFVCIVSSLLSSCSNPAEDYVTVECIVQKRVVMVSSVDWKTEDGSYYFLQEEKYSTNSYKWFVVTPEDVIKVKKYLDNIEPEDKAKDIVPSSPINFENYTPEIVEFRLAEGKVVVLNGGVEQDLTNYLTSLKNPGSGWEHHFKPSTAAGMGAKPTPTSNVGGGQVNPWKTGNITQQMLISEQNPQLAAVLKQEAQKSS